MSVNNHNPMMITKPYMPKGHLVKLLIRANESIDLDVFEMRSSGQAVARASAATMLGVDILVFDVLNPPDWGLVIVSDGSHGVRCTAILLASLLLGGPSRIATGSTPESQLIMAEWGEHDAEMVSKLLKTLNAVVDGEITFRKVEEDAEAYLELQERGGFRRPGLNRLNALRRWFRI
jgi:hypothetical protein